MAEMLSLTSVGATMANLNAGSVARQRLPLPPLEEQERIVHGVDDATLKIEMVKARLESEIELMHEYRTRVVADVVTGKLDVREAAVPSSNEVPPNLAENDAGLIDDSEPVAEEAVA